MDFLPNLDLHAVYERGFRSLLWRAGQRRIEQSVQRWMGRDSDRRDSDDQQRLSQAYRRCRSQVIRLLLLRRERSRSAERGGSASHNGRWRQQTRQVLEASLPIEPVPNSPDFHCDAGLGGLARWLRAAGYDARFWPGIDDDLLIEKTRNDSAIMLTTDRRLMDRAAVQWGAVPALLVPISVKKQQQFQFAVAELQLPRKSPRCMACGGTLQAVDKHLVRDRIPPRTYPWRDDYFRCLGCDKLFWKGTHWRNVAQHLGVMEPVKAL